MDGIRLKILDVMTVPGRKGIVAVVAVDPPTLSIPVSAVFRDSVGGRWQVAEIGNVDPPPTSGRMMLGLLPIDQHTTLDQGAELQQERWE